MTTETKLHRTQELTAAFYRPTPEFLAIPEHCSVARADDMGLVAITGPWDDEESRQEARRFAALWNACKSIPTEALESIKPGVLAGSLNLKDVLERIRDKAGTELNIGQVVGLACEALAKLEGQ